MAQFAKFTISTLNLNYLTLFSPTKQTDEQTPSKNKTKRKKCNET